MTFSDYLTQRKQYSTATAKAYTRHVSGFALYLENEGITPEKLVYKDLIVFISHRQKQGYTKRYINQGLVAVRHWLDYLVEQKRLDYNVANGLFIQGTGRRLPAGLLGRQDLDGLYAGYGVSDSRTLRNKVILGLMVFQGLLVDELRKFTVGDLVWEKGQLRVPQARRANSRLLPIESVQVYHLQTYLKENALEKPDQKLLPAFENG